ncbi:FCH-domain-containing protein [Microthyrium microscopicum]|uniref:Protein BZZ1 n=1 Tax=Microthyrium microscopicum TaxID=703497 RepID=A0A6A6UGK4_9PEZI|nr:FCH-domain-containing protein [Microthyrium microscopicum]
MAQAESAPNFGAELKDAFRPVNSWVAGGITWLDEIQQFFRDRALIEKEYAQKLSALAKRYHEKKGKKASILSVGETPAVTPGSLESASMATWTTQLNALEQRANEHEGFSANLIRNLADPLRNHANRYEELRKAHFDYNTKLEKERDSSYADLKKMKGKYDSVCQEVENKRKKSDGSQRGQVAYQQQMSEMHNVKNTYIISINVTNKQKEMYYGHYVPDLLSSLQDLNESRVDKLNAYWLLAAKIEKDTLKRSIEYMDHVTAEIPRNVPHLDSLMFARHNAGSTGVPPDMAFEPSPVWHDEPTIAIDESAKNFLRNVLLKSKSQLVELKRDVDNKKREVESTRKVRQAIKDGTDKRDEVEVVKAVFQLQELLHESERQKVTAEVEISTITTAVGDVSIGARNHNFKSETFTIPTHCDYCGDRIWGLSAKGFSCRDCGFTCHSKCEMKVPADCPGELTKEEKKKIKASRQGSAQAAMGSLNGSATDISGDNNSLHRSDTMNTLSSGYSARGAPRSVSQSTLPHTDEESPKAPTTIGPRKHRLIAPPPASHGPPSSTSSPEKKGRMLYAFSSTNPGEISVDDGADLAILEPDDGSGWIKVRAPTGTGLVPASYVDHIGSPPSASVLSPPTRPDSSYSTHSSAASLSGSLHALPGRKKGPAVAPKRGAKKLKYVEAIWDYEARTDLEHGMKEGERFVLITPDNGDGWAEVEKDRSVRSVPANYVKEV